MYYSKKIIIDCPLNNIAQNGNSSLNPLLAFSAQPQLQIVKDFSRKSNFQIEYNDEIIDLQLDILFISLLKKIKTQEIINNENLQKIFNSDGNCEEGFVIINDVDNKISLDDQIKLIEEIKKCKKFADIKKLLTDKFVLSEAIIENFAYNILKNITLEDIKSAIQEYLPVPTINILQILELYTQGMVGGAYCCFADAINLVSSNNSSIIMSNRNGISVKTVVTENSFKITGFQKFVFDAPTLMLAEYFENIPAFIHQEFNSQDSITILINIEFKNGHITCEYDCAAQGENGKLFLDVLTKDCDNIQETSFEKIQDEYQQLCQTLKSGSSWEKYQDDINKMRCYINDTNNSEIKEIYLKLAPEDNLSESSIENEDSNDNSYISMIYNYLSSFIYSNDEDSSTVTGDVCD